MSLFADKFYPCDSSDDIAQAEDDRIALRNALNRDELTQLVRTINAPHERRRMFEIPMMPHVRSPRFIRPHKRSRGAVAMY